jgi:organic radical activating enzyme
MPSIRDTISNFFSSVKLLSAGMYHYQSPPDDPRNYRLHLRIESGGSGVLIVNAATILHLNQTAAEYAYYLVHNLPPDQVARKMSSRYGVSRDQAQTDYQDLIERIQTLVNTPDLDPVTFLDFDRQAPLTGHISAPYRLDCALTYNLPTGAIAGAAPAERVARELTTAEWQTVLDKAWQAGIPQLVFTGGEPTLRADLAQLIAHAENNGQVAGLLSDGLHLAEKEYLDSLLQTGLDHLMMIFQHENELSWKALQNALAADLSVAVHLTMTEQNQGRVHALLDRIAQAGVKAISLSASDPALSADLQAARDHSASLDMELVWNLPVPYSSMNPIAVETQEHGLLQGAGRAWLYVEPDGDVLPAQGVTRTLGNLLRDPWEQIWKGQDGAQSP